MTKTIWKYRIEGVSGEFPIPQGGRVVHVEREQPSSREEYVSLWVEVDDKLPTEQRSFGVYGTGHPVPVDSEYLGTVTFFPLPIVVHAYELGVEALLEKHVAAAKVRKP